MKFNNIRLLVKDYKICQKALRLLTTPSICPLWGMRTVHLRVPRRKVD